jgi:hypothetical protein
MPQRALQAWWRRVIQGVPGFYVYFVISSLKCA